jgi:hypothetical protein
MRLGAVKFNPKPGGVLRDSRDYRRVDDARRWLTGTALARAATWYEVPAAPPGLPDHRRRRGMAKKRSGRRYGKKASRKVEKAMHEMKRGKLKSGRSGKKVKSRKQAIAIGLSQARREGGKVPKKTG